VIRNRGKRSHANFTNGLCKLLLRHRQEVTHPDPDRAVLACTRLMWSSFGGFLGIESDESAGEGDWRELIEDVTQMGLFFFLSRDRTISVVAPNGKRLRDAEKGCSAESHSRKFGKRA
jgi:hypothetical protein